MAADEQALLQRWIDGDTVAGEALFERYYKPLTRFFINKVSHAQDVEALVQRTFMVVLEGADKFRGASSVRTWFFGIARNLIRQHYDQRRREAKIESDDFSVADMDAVGASTLLRGKAEQRLLLHALRRLPLEAQVALELHYWEQMSSAQIGDVLGMPAATVRGHLRKARAELRDRLTELAQTPQLLESTTADLEGWAHGLREVWGV